LSLTLIGNPFAAATLTDKPDFFTLFAEKHRDCDPFHTSAIQHCKWYERSNTSSTNNKGPIGGSVCACSSSYWGVSTTVIMVHLSAARSACPAAVLVLVTSLLLGACAATDSRTQEKPVIFGNAQGANGGVGATSGMSFSW
jgi:hypothetical protein